MKKINRLEKKDTTNFNFIIARYWNGKDGQLCVYMVRNNDVQYGTQADAEYLLNWVLRHTEETDYQIFKIKETK